MAPGGSKKKGHAPGLKFRLPARPRVPDTAPIEERVAARKTEMLLARQATLERVKDEHDDMVRELFHLDKFVTLLHFDPRVAKEDNSSVFLDYKAQYDLASKTSLPQQSATRKTRSAAVERRESFSALIQTPLKHAAPTPSRSPLSDAKESPSPLVMKSKRKSLAQHDDVAAAHEDDPRQSPLVRPLKITFNKGKQKAEPPVVDVAGDDPFAVPASEDMPGPKKRARGLPVARASSRRASVLGDLGEIPAPTPEVATTKPSRKSSRYSLVTVHDPLPPDGAVAIPSSEVPKPPAKTARKTSRQTLVTVHDPLSPVDGAASIVRKPPRAALDSLPQDEAPTTGARSLRKRKRSPSPSPTPTPTPSPTPPPALPLDSPLRRIKRVKLVHRIPYSHPAQIPPLPKHGGSLRALLESYHDLGDEEDLPRDMAALHAHEREEALLRRRIDAFRAQGRLLPAGFDLAAGLAAAPDPDAGGAWRGIVAEVEAREGRKVLVDARGGAGKVARLVGAHFGRVVGSDEQRRKADERRLRKLAKETIRDVTNEWRKAVFHIREKKNAQLREEEARRGKMHLDEILAQSGSMLEAQAEDLLLGTQSRSRSRSASVAASFRVGDEEEEEEDEEDDEEDDEGSASRQESSVDDEEEGDEEGEDDVGIGVLLRDENDTGQEHDGRDDDDEDVEMALVEDHVSLEADGDDDEPRTRDVSIADDPSTPSRSRARSMSVRFEEVEDLPSRASQAGISTREGSVQEDAGLTSSLLSKPASAPFETHADDTTNEPGSIASTQEHSRATSTTSGEVVPSVEAGAEQDVLMADDAPGPAEQDAVDLEDGTAQDTGARENSDDEFEEDVPEHLRDFAVAPVEWDPNSKVVAPLLLRGNLRPYQQSGLEWLASLHMQSLNGILADEMGLGKTIQTIALLAHLACDRGIWGPHLVVVPTSVLLNWEMEFKKFLPGFRILAYHGSTKRRKDLRAGWTNPYAFNVCVTSYALASRDAMLFKRKAWYYMILDEAHMIKNFKSQRWNTLLGFRSRRRLLLTGTPLQNNLTELWSLLQFLMSGSNFANLKEFGEWFANPLEKAIEQGTALDQETKERVQKLHTVLRPYLLRRLKADVERELPQKYDHLVLCKLSKRQRHLYDDFMSRAQTRAALDSGVYQKIANILMQLRKVCNHPDLFEVRPIVSPFAMPRSAVADFEIKELLVRKRFFEDQDASDALNLDLPGFRFTATTVLERASVAVESRAALCASDILYSPDDYPEEVAPPRDTRTIDGFREYSAWRERSEAAAAQKHLAHVNKLKCIVRAPPVFGAELLRAVRMPPPLRPLEHMEDVASRRAFWTTGRRAPAMVRSIGQRAEECAPLLDHFMCTIPAVRAPDVVRLAIGAPMDLPSQFDAPLHRAISLRAIAFPDAALLQYDCGKLQELFLLLRRRQLGGHRVLIFTQMTKVLDILEAFLNLHGWRYLRLDGATKIEDRQYITERFNSDTKVFAFIASSRSGGVGINLTGADTVIFYDSDFNPQMDKQCEDRAHRIGQIRDVHIYRFISAHTVEEAMLRKANQKRALDDLVIQQGGFDWRRVIFDVGTDADAVDFAAGEMGRALEAEEDDLDARARHVAQREEAWRLGEDEEDFGAEKPGASARTQGSAQDPNAQEDAHEDVEEGGTIADYMLAMVERDWEWFSTWRV